MRPLCSNSCSDVVALRISVQLNHLCEEEEQKHLLINQMGSISLFTFGINVSPRKAVASIHIHRAKILLYTLG